MFRVTDGLTLSANYTYMHAKEFLQFDNPFTPAVDLTRFYSIQTPKHSGYVAVGYESRDLGFGKFALHVDYAVTSGWYATPGGVLVASLGPNYVRPKTITSQLNGRAALKDLSFGAVKTELAVFAKNILQDTHYVYSFDGCGSGAGYCEFQTAPRTFGVELRVRY